MVAFPYYMAKGLFIQNATAAWRRSRRNGINTVKQTKVVHTERDRDRGTRL